MANITEIKTDTFTNLINNIKQEFKNIYGRPLTLKDITVVKTDIPKYSGVFQISAINKEEFVIKVKNISNISKMFENEACVISLDNSDNLNSQVIQNNNIKKPKMK